MGRWDDLPEEIVEEILVRLETKPLFKLKCVSKQLEGKISDPEFGRSYSQRARSSRMPMPRWRLWGMPYPCVPTHQPEHTFLASGNGLMLYRSYNEKPDNDDNDSKEIKEWVVYRFRVCNPLTKQAVQLPPLWLPRSKWLVGFATRLGDRNTNMSYVTFRVVVLGLNLLHATVFSSETGGSWAREELIHKCPDFLFKYTEDRDVACYKGVLHWSDMHERAIVSYDPYNRPHRFGYIQMPSNVGLNCKVLIHLGGQEGDDEDLKMIKYGDIVPSNGTHITPRLRVWGLVDYDKGEWSLEQSFPVTTSCEEVWTRFNLFVVAPDPTSGMGRLSYCLFRGDNVIEVVDLASGEEVIVYPVADKVRSRFDDDPECHMMYVFHAYCPWSSPSYCGQAWSSDWLPLAFWFLHKFFKLFLICFTVLFCLDSSHVLVSCMFGFCNVSDF